MFYLGNGSYGLKASSGNFVSCDINNDKRLFINSAWFGTWETFKLIEQPNNTYALKAINGKYVSLKQQEGNILKADVDSIASNETFIIY